MLRDGFRAHPREPAGLSGHPRARSCPNPAPPALGSGARGDCKWEQQRTQGRAFPAGTWSSQAPPSLFKQQPKFLNRDGTAVKPFPRLCRSS